MVLTRSDSQQSAWFPSSGDEQAEVFLDERRIRHLSAVLVRNLNLSSNHDTLPSKSLRPSSLRSLDLAPNSPTFSLSTVPNAQRDKDAAKSGQGKGKGRARSTSTSSWSGSISGYEAGETSRAENERELVLDASSSSSTSGFRPSSIRTRPRRSSSAGTLLTRLPSSLIEEESESPTSPNPAQTPSASTSRPSSSSRLSASSIQSSSTIRQAPRLPTAQEQARINAAEERPPAPRGAASSLFAQQEKRRREEALRRRLLDSFITLELMTGEEEEPQRASSPVLERRRRGASVVSVRPGGNRMRRSDSASSVLSTASLGSPRNAMLRQRTSSSPFLPTSSSLASSSDPKPPPSGPPQPFFVSPPSLSATNPAFPVDKCEFLLPPSTSSASFLEEAERRASWSGLRESRFKAKVFVRERRTDDEGSKGKEREVHRGEDEWSCLVEWDVALDGLSSLGRDPAAFPSLPPNTLVFALSPSSPFSTASSSTSSDLEYFTAPLPLLHKALRRSARESRVSRRTDAFVPRGAVSEEDLSDDSLGSSSDENGDGAGGGAREDGNLSDPGVPSFTFSGARARSGTLVLRRRAKRDSRKRLLAERLRAEDDRRRRAAVVEKSRRETKMVKAPEWEKVGELWEGEKEIERLRVERAELRHRIEEGMEENCGELVREKAELEDRVEDLEGVREAVDEDVEEVRADLEARKTTLRLRRARLEAAKMMDEDNIDELGKQKEALDEVDRTLVSLAADSFARRTQLITLLSSIFPIEPVVAASSSTSSDLLFSICGLSLPNSAFSSSPSDDVLSSALGYAAQLTQMLAAYLAVPLVYPIRSRGSRSTVLDEISMMKGPRAFPLYGKGVDQYRFDYGVFLLNKDIEQLMYSQTLTVLDLRNTLPNLKTLVLSLSHDPSHPDYRASNLLPLPPFDVADTSRESSRSRSPSPAGSSVDSANGSTSTASEAGSTPASSTSSLPPPFPPQIHAVPSPLPPSSSTRTSRSPSLASTIRARSTSPAPTVRDGDQDGSTNLPAASSTEKRPPRSSSVDAFAIDGAPPALPLKTHLIKKDRRSARPRSSSGSSAGGGGYGKRLADGLWSAVAGSYATTSRGRSSIATGAAEEGVGGE